MYWLLIERRENWEVDQREGFRRFGVPEHKQALAGQIRKGDTLIIYVSSGISSFAGIRTATANGVTKLGFGGAYDTAFPLAVATEPQLTLERPDWVPIHSLVDRLSLIAGKKEWRQVMRTALRPLPDGDAETIIDAMQHAAQKHSSTT